MGRIEPRAQHAMQLSWRLNRCSVGMDSPDRDLGRDVYHYERVGTWKGTLMRHFLCSALAPSSLPGRVQRRSAATRLVALTGAAHGLMPADLGALSGAIPVASVAVAADPQLLCAVPATVQPIRILAWMRTSGQGLVKV